MDIKQQIFEFIKGIFIILLFFIMSIAFKVFFSDYIQSDNIFVSNISLILTSLLITIIFFIIYRENIIDDFKDFKLHFKEYIFLGLRYWIIGFLIMVVVNNLLINVIGDIASNEAANREVLVKTPIYAIISMCFLGPFNEELTFRLGIRKAFKNSLFYCLVSAFLFGYAHVMGTSLLEHVYIIPYGALGFFFAKAYYDTNNIFTSTFMHVLHNSLAVFLILIAL